MLFKKMRRDMQRQKMQFISVLIMAFLGLMLFSGLSSMWYGIETYLADYQANTNLAGVWAYSENFTAQDVINATQQEGIEAAQRRLRLSAARPGASGAKLEIYFLENNAINAPLVTEGVQIDPQDTASIWLDREFARANELNVGDPFSFTIGNVVIEKKIAGLVYSSEQTYSRNSSSIFVNHKEVGFGYCSIAGFPIKAFVTDQLATGEVDTEEILDDMLTEKYPEFVDSAVDQRYDELVDAMVEQDYEGLVDSLVDENYAEIVDTLVEDRREEIIDRYVTENYAAAINRMVDENYDEILREYVTENYDSILEEYVTNNRESIIDTYVNENYYTILYEYIYANRDELIRTYVDENFDALVRGFIDENFDEILDRYIINNRNALIRTYIDKNFDALVEDYIDANFDAILNQYISANRDALIRSYVQVNFDALADRYIDQNFTAILAQYVAANRDALILDYVTANFDALANEYIDQNYDAVLDAIIYSLYTPEEIAESGLTMEELRQQIILTYSDAAIHEMARQLLTVEQVAGMVSATITNEQLQQAILLQYGEDGVKALLKQAVTIDQLVSFIGSSITDETLRQTLLNEYGEDGIKAMLKQSVTKDQIIDVVSASITNKQLRALVLSIYGETAIKEMIKQGISKADVIQAVSDSLSDYDLLKIIAEVMTVDKVKETAAREMSNADLIAEAKKRYTAEDAIDLVKSDYSPAEVKDIVREEYSPAEIKNMIDEEYTNDELKDKIREFYSPDELKQVVKDQYSADDLKETIRDHYPPDEMKQKLLSEYSAEDMRELILHKYPGDQLRDMLVDNLNAVDEQAFESDIIFNELLLVTDRTDLSALEQDLNQVLENDVVALLERGVVPGVYKLPERISALKVISNIFPPVFIAIAILTIITTMSRMVVAQRTQIGILKALGYSKRKIIRHYLGYAFYPSAAGSFLGVLIGPRIVPRVMFRPLSRIYTLPEWNAAITPLAWEIAVACVLVCIAACYFAVREILAEYPAESLRLKASVRLNLRSVGQSQLWQRLSFLVQWNIRDVFRSKVRSIMGIVGALSSMALLICGFALQDTFQDTMRWLYEDIQTYETQILLDSDASLDEAAVLAQQVGGQLMMSSVVELHHGANLRTASLTVVEDTSLFQVTDSNKNPIVLGDGDIAVSRKVAAILGIQPGGSMTWRMTDDNEWTTATVTALNTTPMGQGVVMTRATFASLNGEFTPTSIITDRSVASIDSPQVKAVYAKQDLLDSWNLSMESLTRITFILMAAAFILSVVVLYNLGLLSFSEKERELATLKVLGFKSRVIRRLLLIQNVWFTVIGLLLGIPVGGWLIRQIVAFLGSDFDLRAVYTNTSLILCAAVVLTISIATNLAFSTRLKTLDMVAAFKSVE